MAHDLCDNSLNKFFNIFNLLSQKLRLLDAQVSAAASMEIYDKLIVLIIDIIINLNNKNKRKK
jgi:hypothetical protein